MAIRNSATEIFAVIAYVEGSPTILDALDKSDTIFLLLFSLILLIMLTLLRKTMMKELKISYGRTGNVISQIDALWSLREIKPDLHKIAVDSIDKFKFLPRAELPDNKGISSLQRKAIELRRGESAIVFAWSSRLR